MKRAILVLSPLLMVVLPLFLFAGCYTQTATTGGGEGSDVYVSGNPVYDDSAQQGDYDAARQRFYYDTYYVSAYPAWSVGFGIGFGWSTPWYGYGYPYYGWGYPYYGWNYPYYGGYYPYYGGYYPYYHHGHGYYGAGYPSRSYGMVRTTGGTRSSSYAPGVRGSSVSLSPAGRASVERGARAMGSSFRRGTVAPGTSSVDRGGTRLGVQSPSSRSPQGMSSRGPQGSSSRDLQSSYNRGRQNAYSRSGSSGVSAPRYTGRGFSNDGRGSAPSGGRASVAPRSAPAPSGGGGSWGGGGRSGGGGGGGGRSGGGGGRR